LLVIGEACLGFLGGTAGPLDGNAEDLGLDLGDNLSGSGGIDATLLGDGLEE